MLALKRQNSSSQERQQLVVCVMSCHSSAFCDCRIVFDSVPHLWLFICSSQVTMIKVFALIYASELITCCTHLFIYFLLPHFMWFLAVELTAFLHTEYFAFYGKLFPPAGGTVSRVSGCRRKQWSRRLLCVFYLASADSGRDPGTAP